MLSPSITTFTSFAPLGDLLLQLHGSRQGVCEVGMGGGARVGVSTVMICFHLVIVETV
jgi:hypothetical protein